MALLTALLLVAFFSASALASCSRCEKGWFLPNQKYVYKYEAVAAAGFVGTSDERSGLKLSCIVNVITPCQCNDVTKVSLNKCEMTEKNNQGYSQTDQSYAKNLEKRHIEFVLEDGLIKHGKIMAHKQDSESILNMKRAIIRTLQLKMQAPEKYEQILNQQEIFGTCPVQYSFSKTKPWTIHTKMDITHCDLPSIFEFQFKLKSLIKTVYGGRQVKNISEMIYPFDSTYNCDYTVTDEQKITSVSCLQNQAFRVLKHYGNIDATAMYNISQSLTFKENANAMLKDKKMKIPKSKVKDADLKFVFVHEHRKVFGKISAAELKKSLEDLVTAYVTRPMRDIPGLFNGFVDRIRQASQNVLEETFSMIKVCPEHDQGCDNAIPVLQQRFYMDALKSCGDIRCVKTIVNKLDRIIAISKALFLYDLALNFEPDAELLHNLLDLCKKEKKQSCTTLTILAKRFSKNVDMNSKENKIPILKTIKFYHHHLEATVGRDDADAETDLIWIMKGLENLGSLVQDLHDECIRGILKIVTSRKYSLSLRNAGIKALRAMNFDTLVEKELKEILADVYESVSLRSQAFLTLDKYARKKSVKYIIEILRQEKIQQLTTYMATHILNVLESEEPTWKERQTVWKESLADEKEPIPALKGGGFARGKSSYVEVSKSFVFPFTSYNIAAQLELSIIYDPSNLVPKSIIFRTKGLLGKTDYELLEITLEAEGMEKFMQSLSKTHGKSFFQRLMGIIHFFNAPPKQDDEDFTFFLEQKILDELKDILQMVKLPENSMPSGFVHIKIFGGNLATLNLKSLFHYMHLPNLKMFLVETLRKSNLKLIQASRFVELYRSLPSVFGAPFNLTLSSTRVNSLNISTSLGLGQLLPPKNIAMNAGLQTQFILEFRARMELTLPGLRPHGLGMNTDLDFYGGGSGGMTLTSEDRSDRGVIQYWKSRIHINNIYEPADLVKIKHRIYILRSGKLERISADQDPAIKKYVFDGCTGARVKALLGRKICIQMSYPDVYQSNDHPYTPLTGDVDFRFYVVPNDIALLTYNIDIEREIKKDKRNELVGNVKVRCNAPGSGLERQLNIDILQREHNNYLLVDIMVPELNNLKYSMEFQSHEEAHDYELKFNTGLGFHGTDFIAIHLDVLKQTAIPGIKTDYLSLLDFKLQIMDILLNLTLENSLKNKNKLLLAHMRYHCSQRWPVLFELHADTEHASQHHDLTEMKFKMACEVLPHPKRQISMKRTWDLLYPGNHFHLDVDLKGSKPSTQSTGKLTWNHPLGQEVLWLTGTLIDKGTPKKVDYKYDLTFDHKVDSTIIKVDAVMSGTPMAYDIVFNVDYNKRQMRRKRSWPELSMQFKRVSEGIKRGIFNVNEPPPLKVPDPPKKTTKWVNPLANSPPGPHKDVFMNFFEFMKNGPKKWTSEGNAHVTIRPVLDKHASHPIGAEIILKGSLDYPTWTKKENIKGAFIYAKSIKIMQKGKTMKGHFSIESTKTQGGVLFEFDMSKHQNYLDYSHNLTLWSVVSGEITREFIVDIKHRGNHLFNMTQRLLTGPLNGSIDVIYNKNQQLGVHYLKIDSDISDSCGVIKSKYKCEQHWSGFFTPEYMLKRTSSLDHSIFRYDSSWNLQRNADKLTMDLQASVKPKVLFLIETDGHVTILFTKDMPLPDVKLKLDLPRNGIKFRGFVESEKEFKLKMDFKKPGQPVISGITWSIILDSPTKVKNVIIWNPHLTKMTTKAINSLRQPIMRQINYQMDVMISNVLKPFSDMILAPIDLTVNELFDLIVLSNIRSVIPYLDNLPLSSRPVSHAVYERLYKLGIAYEKVQKSIGSSGFNSQYQHLRKGFTVILSTILKYIKERINHPPRIVSDYFTQIVSPQLMPSVESNTFEFSIMHPFIWESFTTAPRLSHTSMFFMGYFYEPGYFLFREYLPSAAINFENKMVTFDGMVYSLPEDFDNEKCIHLLSADLRKKKFSVLREGDAITLVCSKTRVKVSRDCKIYIDGSDMATELPYECPMKMVTAKMWGPYLIVNSIFGVEISCDPENLKVILDGQHLSNTIGLLGTSDGDLGTDMRLSDGTFAANKAKFINHFELSRKKICQVTPEQLKPKSQTRKCSDEIRKRCMETFASYKSPFLKCFLTVNPKYFLMQCLKDVTSCKADVMNIELCRVMHLYALHCVTKMPIHMPKQCVLCDESKGEKWKVSTNKQKRDIVIIVDQNQEINGYRPLYYFMNLFENAKIENAQMGLVACGGEGIFEHPNVYTMEGRHFGTENTLTMALKTLNEGMKPSKHGHQGMDHGDMHDQHGQNSHGHDDKHRHEGHIPRLHIDHSPHHVGHRITDLHQALEWASDYPFKPESGRMIMLFADMTILRNLTDLGSILATIVEKDIIVNIFTNTKDLLGKKAVGITASGKVLAVKKKKQIQPTPLIEYFSLIKNTNGILWNIESILTRRQVQVKIIKIINEEFEKQMATKKCRQCKCVTPKHELMGRVQCVASTCSK